MIERWHFYHFTGEKKYRTPFCPVSAQNGRAAARPAREPVPSAATVPKSSAQGTSLLGLCSSCPAPGVSSASSAQWKALPWDQQEHMTPTALPISTCLLEQSWPLKFLDQNITVTILFCLPGTCDHISSFFPDWQDAFGVMFLLCSCSVGNLTEDRDGLLWNPFRVTLQLSVPGSRNGLRHHLFEGNNLDAWLVPSGLEGSCLPRGIPENLWASSNFKIKLSFEKL